MDRYKTLSKFVALALRHQPQRYGLTLDPQGWVALDLLIAAIRRHQRHWPQVTSDDLKRMIAQSDKARFELADGRIRATYGHSIAKKISHLPAAPPERLYHGTSPHAAQAIALHGLKPMKRQYVHLSSQRETAIKVGKRKAATPVILIIEAQKAAAAGLVFYHGNDDTWLCEAIPPAFLCTQ